MSFSSTPAPVEPPAETNSIYVSDAAKDAIVSGKKKISSKLPPVSAEGTGVDAIMRVSSVESTTSSAAGGMVVERIVGKGLDVPQEGMRVMIRRAALMKNPELKKESGQCFLPYQCPPHCTVWLSQDCQCAGVCSSGVVASMME